MSNLNHGSGDWPSPGRSGPRSAEQRRSPRYSAGWAAYYRLDPGDDWRECRVVDVSLDGAALELQGATLVDGIVGPIEIQIASAAGNRVGVALRAVIRRHEQRDDGQVIAGVEFGVLRPEERNVLQLLIGLRSQQ